MKSGMRAADVAPRVGRFKKAKAKATKTDYIKDKLAKLKRVAPAKPNPVEGISGPARLVIQRDTKARPTY